jgi:hypothetical protein
MGWPEKPLDWVAYIIGSVSLLVSVYQLLKGLGFGRIGRAIVVADENAFRRRSLRALRGARDQVYRSGTGVAKENGNIGFGPALFAVDQHLQETGVQNIRLQTMTEPNRDWAAAIASLKKAEPERAAMFRFYDATDKPWPFEICLVDPAKRRSVIIIYFEQDHDSLPTDTRQFMTSIFIYRDRSLSAIYKQRFDEWRKTHKDKEKTTPKAIREFLNVPVNHESKMATGSKLLKRRPRTGTAVSPTSTASGS